MNLFSIKSLSLSLVPPSQRRIFLQDVKYNALFFSSLVIEELVLLSSPFFVLLVITENR